MAKLKKTVLTLLAFLVFSASSLTLFTSGAQAESSWYSQSYEEWSTKVYDPKNPTEIFGERYTAAQVEWVIYGLIGFLQNHTGSAEINGCIKGSDNPLQGILDCQKIIIRIRDTIPGITAANIFSSTQVVASSNILNVFTNRPVSSIAYFKDVAQRLKFIPEAKAQGFGFRAANPILNLWKTARDTAYALLIIVIVIMAFMIMFRVRLSPQTVISVQSALPKVIIALILITFSYAIAGFMIDLMYVAIGLVAGILSNSELFGSPFNDWSNMFNALTTDRSVFSLTAYYFLSFSVAFMISSWASGLATAVVGSIIWIVVVLSVFVVLIFAFGKTIWLLIKTYISILLTIVVGPFQILLGIFGGGGFGAWIKTLISHLAVYPVVGLMFILAFFFIRQSLPNCILQNCPYDWSWLVPFDPEGVIGNNAWTPPLTFSNDMPLLWLLSSLAIVVLTPKAAEMIKGAMSGKPFGYGSAIGEGFAVGGTAIRGGGQYISTLEQQIYANAGRTASPRVQRFHRLAQAVRAITGLK